MAGSVCCIPGRCRSGEFAWGEGEWGNMQGLMSNAARN